MDHQCSPSVIRGNLKGPLKRVAERDLTRNEMTVHSRSRDWVDVATSQRMLVGTKY